MVFPHLIFCPHVCSRSVAAAAARRHGEPWRKPLHLVAIVAHYYRINNVKHSLWPLRLFSFFWQNGCKRASQPWCTLALRPSTRPSFPWTAGVASIVASAFVIVVHQFSTVQIWPNRHHASSVAAVATAATTVHWEAIKNASKRRKQVQVWFS